MKPRLLDVFCGAGGCTAGYQRAGFYVVGVDIKPQPNYCGQDFIQSDALAFLRSDPEWISWYFDAIHASPPCQAYLNLGGVNRALGRAYNHADLIAATRKRLKATGLPYVIENVEGAPLHSPIRLCGSSFGLAVRRHRLFETTFGVMAPPCAHHLQREAKYWTGWRPKGEHRLASVVQVYGNAGDSSQWAAAMGIDWMTRDELSEAIPPAYCEHVGAYLLAEINAKQVKAA